MKHKFAAQLYSLRKDLTVDFVKVLRELKKQGWEAVQMDGLRGHSALEVAEGLKETGLKVVSMHANLDRMNNDLDNIIYEALLFGTKDVFCSSELTNEEDVLFAMNEMLNDCKEKLSKLIRDEETLKNYLMLVELIQTCLYEEFEHSQPAVGIILYWYNMILESETPDLIKRTFSVNPFPYYLLKNKNKITCISCV